MIPWNKGKKGVQKCSEETKKKLRSAHLGKKYKPMSNEGKRNMSLAHIGKISNNKGKRASEITRLKMRESSLIRFSNKENHPRWKNGISEDRSQYSRARRNRKNNAEGSHTR